MIRCIECEHFKPMIIQHKMFYRCIADTNGSICNGVTQLWDKIPRTHPRWCPLWVEEKKELASKVSDIPIEKIKRVCI